MGIRMTSFEFGLHTSVGTVPVIPDEPYDMLVVDVGPRLGNLESSIQPHLVPIEFADVTFQLPMLLERAKTSLGMSSHNLFDYGGGISC